MRNLYHIFRTSRELLSPSQLGPHVEIGRNTGYNTVKEARRDLLPGTTIVKYYCGGMTIIESSPEPPLTTLCSRCGFEFGDHSTTLHCPSNTVSGQFQWLELCKSCDADGPCFQHKQDAEKEYLRCLVDAAYSNGELSDEFYERVLAFVEKGK